MRKIDFITLILIFAISSLFSQESQELDYNIVATGPGYGVQGSQYIIELQMRAHTTGAELGSGQMRINYDPNEMTLNTCASSINSDIVNYNPFGLGLSYSTDHVYSPTTELTTGKVQAGIVFDQTLAGLAYNIPTDSWLNFAHIVFDIITFPTQLTWIKTTPETQFYAEDNVTSHTNNLFFGIDSDPILPVTLSSFNGIFSSGLARLQWTTQSESNNAFWNVYRSVSQNLGQSVQVNYELLPGAGTTSEPRDYLFNDSSLTDYLQDEEMLNPTIYYWIESVDNSGYPELHGPVAINVINSGEEYSTPGIPDVHGLNQNYPNPFNPETGISFNLAKDSKASLVVYNVKGEKVKTLFRNKECTKNQTYIEYWNGTDSCGNSVSSGIYLSVLKTDKDLFTRKMILQK